MIYEEKDLFQMTNDITCLRVSDTAVSGIFL